MKKGIATFLTLVSTALVLSVVSLNTSYKSQPKEIHASDLSEDELYFAPAATVTPAYTYTNDPKNEPWYASTKSYKSNASGAEDVYYERNQKTTVFDRMNISNTWNSYRGESVKVAVIDTGCYTSHEDFNGSNILTTSKNMVTDTTGLAAVNDTHGHGTTSAAMICAAVNNAGGTGIAPNVEVIILKCVDTNNAFSNASILNALTYCIDNGVDIINMSIQGYDTSFNSTYIEDFGNYETTQSSTGIMSSTYLTSKITDCYNAGITVVAAAGNYNTNKKSYPAANDHVIAVASTGLTEANKYNKAGYSNYGDWVDICAPGYVYRPLHTSSNGYSVWNGTSFSAPLVSGAIALYKSKYPTATPDQIEKALKFSAHKLSWTGSGAGAIDVAAFLDIPPDYAYVESVTLPENSKTLTVGETYQLNPTVLPSTANQNVEYYNVDDTVCTVDSSGLVTAIAEGESAIEVYSAEDSSKSADIYITVESAGPKQKTLTLSSGTSSGTGNDTVLTWTEAGVISISQARGTGNAPSSSYISEPSWYQNNVITFTPLNGSTITSIEFICGTNDYASGLKNSTWSAGSAASSSTTVTWTGSATSAFTAKMSAQSRITTIKVTYLKGSTVNYTVSFNANGGSGTMDNDTTTGSSYVVPACTFTRTNYTFSKWALNSDSGTQYSVGDTITDISGNITLYAKWNSSSASGYYDSITATSGSALLAQLHTLMGSTHSTYTTYDDCKTPDKVYSTDPGTTSSYITDFYTQNNIGKSWGSGATGTWNREHVWCQSLSSGLWGETYGGSDLHHVRPVESTLNSTRNNHPFGIVPTHDSNTAKYSKNTSDNYTSYQGGWYQTGLDRFEPMDNVKGDVARILMYVFMHYSNSTGGTDGSVSGHTGSLSITKIVSTSTGTAQAAWDLLLGWNTSDPVSTAEITRNEAAYSIQGNRNPFIDHPEYASAIWVSTPVTKTLSSITLSGSHQTTFNVGDTFSSSDLVVTAHYSDNTEAIVTPTNISSPDMSTAGSKTITVTYTEGGVTKTATYNITVNAIQPTSISISQSTLSLKTGGSSTLTATVSPDNATDKSVTWTSSDNTVATVSNGVVTARKAGSATITAKTSNNLTATCSVTVTDPVVTGVTLDVESKSIDLTTQSHTFSLTATVTAEDGATTTVTWTSSDETIVRAISNPNASAAGTTTSTGYFEVLKAGEATITATAGSKTGTCSVTVTQSQVITGYQLSLDNSTIRFSANKGSGSAPAKVLAVYEGGSTSEVANVNVSVDTTSLGNKEVSYVYEGQTLTGSIKVTNNGTEGHIGTGETDEATPEAQALAWANYFISMTRTESTCLASTDSAKLTGLKAVWSELSAEYGYMVTASKTAFCSSSATEIIKTALQHYQYIISKFGTSELSDFVVDGSGNKPVASSSNKYSLTTMFNVENGSLIVGLLSLIGLASIVTFVVVKKRKTY